MGEVSDLITNGYMCQQCHRYIYDEKDGFDGADGYPRYCRACGGDPACNGAMKVKKQKSKRKGEKR